jgi:hypothetical protein
MDGGGRISSGMKSRTKQDARVEHAKTAEKNKLVKHKPSHVNGKKK